MPIFFKAPPEPLAGPPGDEAGPDPERLRLAESVASERLETIIEAYCNRTIAGRSILIAAHRGGGKTTLVKSVIHNLRRNIDLRSTAIPLYVQIHGPDLLGGEEVLGPDLGGAKPEPKKPDTAPPPADASRASAAPETKPPGVSPGARKQDRDEAAQALCSLRVLIIALHRAFVTDLGWAFERSVSRGQAANDQQLPAQLKKFPDLPEVAAQLRLDFDDLVETDALRWTWKRAGILGRGILRWDTSPQDIAAGYFSQQGLLEVVAASCVSDSFTRGVAQVDDSATSKSAAEITQSHEIEKMQERKEFANAIAGILGGVIAGGGVAVSSPHTPANGIVSGLVFVLASVFTTLLLNFTSSRKRSRSRTRERNIRWDRSVASLDLMLPLAVARILDAGRAPIFVIDELDKVREIEEKLGGLINRLKHIVADRALVCFLVDRPYFERMQEISLTESQRKEHTFFSERLFVAVTPAQWRDYLRSVITVPNPSPSETLQVTALTYWLMARSKMHAIDMRRELDKLAQKRKTGLLSLPDMLGEPLYRNIIYMQAVVEYQLQDDKLKRRMERDSGFVQYASDALYYLLRQWEQDKQPDVSRASLKAYLEKRARPEEIEIRDKKESQPAA